MGKALHDFVSGAILIAKKSKNVYQYGKDFETILIGKEIEVSPQKMLVKGSCFFF